MSRFSPGTARRVLLRSLFVQGSWNYETLIGTGFAFTIVPVLRSLHPADDAAFRDALSRHAEVFNSHPYFATVAVGAISRLEADGVDPRVIGRFKSALRGSLGSVGDQLVWSAWRPACALLGVFLILAGAAWWVGVMAFLLIYNALNLGLRAWGWQVGTSAGLEVGRALREAPLQPLARRAGQIGALLGGAALALAVTADPQLDDPTRLAVRAAAIAAGVWLGSRTRHAMAAVVTIALAVGIVTGMLG